jgi:hypothetical protein
LTEGGDIYRLLCSGGLSIYQGYRLFMAGIIDANSGIEASDGGRRKIKLSKIAPGIFFALFGATILVVSLSRPLDTQIKSSDTPAKGDAKVIEQHTLYDIKSPEEHVAHHPDKSVCGGGSGPMTEVDVLIDATMLQGQLLVDGKPCLDDVGMEEHIRIGLQRGGHDLRIVYKEKSCNVHVTTPQDHGVVFGC